MINYRLDHTSNSFCIKTSHSQ